MKKNTIFLLTLVAVAVLFYACDSDDPVKPAEPPIDNGETTTGSLSITVDHVFGNQTLPFNQDVTLPSMEIVQLSRYAYILSNFALTAEDGSIVELKDQYALIEAHNDMTSFTLTSVPTGTYTKLRFSLGLDSAVNHGNPNVYNVDHPLSPIRNSLHWNWQGGYIFSAIEGKTMADDESFVFHLAGIQNKLDFELALPLVKTEAEQNATLTYDVQEVFQGPQVYTISQDGTSSHSISSPVTVKLIANMKDVFTQVEMK